MNHFDALAGLLDLQGVRAVDIGAGKGEFAGQLARAGARVVAVEIDEDKVRSGNSAGEAGVEFRLGRAECLPVEDASCDLACFMFSFHHVPDELQPAALLECARALSPGGRLHVVDPLPRGSMTEIVKLLEDETAVRIASQDRLRNLSTSQFRLTRQSDYILTRSFEGFDQLVERVASANAARADRLPTVIDTMRQAFEQSARVTETGYELDQPCVMFHFERM